jgi:hypothetical protein
VLNSHIQVGNDVWEIVSVPNWGVSELNESLQDNWFQFFLIFIPLL